MEAIQKKKKEIKSWPKAYLHPGKGLERLAPLVNELVVSYDISVERTSKKKKEHEPGEKYTKSSFPHGRF